MHPSIVPLPTEAIDVSLLDSGHIHTKTGTDLASCSINAGSSFPEIKEADT